MLAGNANFNAKADLADQAPVYFATVAGISNRLYSTAKVQSVPGGTTEKIVLDLPEISPGGIDLLEGSWTVAQVRLKFFDVGGEASLLFGVGGASAPVATWKNRHVTLWGGYRDLGWADYVKLFTGPAVGLELGPALGSYILTLADTSYMLDGELATAATADEPATIRGNVVNVFASLLRGVFSTSDAHFPLLEVSTASAGVSSAPTGLGIPDALLDIAGMKAERDSWRPDDTVELEFRAPEAAREYLRREFFRVFQARLCLLGNGSLGFRFNRPPMPATSAPVLDLGTIAEVRSWAQLLEDHLNKFTIRGDHDPDADPEFADLYADSTTEDTDDRTETGETVEYVIESRWLRTADDGVFLASDLAAHIRQVWLVPPALVSVGVNFRQRRIEPGDVVAVTHPLIPDLRSGVRGVSGRLMHVLRAEPDTRAGLVVLELLDVGLRRYGVIAPASVGSEVYTGADAVERGTFFFVCNGSEQMSNGDDGYRFV